MALKGAVAEKHLSILLHELVESKAIKSVRSGDGDFEKDFYVRVAGRRDEIAIECKNVMVINWIGSLKRDYLSFLLSNKYLDEEAPEIKAAVQSALTEGAPRPAIPTAMKELPQSLRESGLSRYAFSRHVCDVDRVKPLSPTTYDDYMECFAKYPLRIDFQRTRNSGDAEEKDSKANRFYRVGEVAVLAACLFSRTMEWQFIYCSAKSLAIHSKYKERHDNSVVVDPSDWTADILDVL